MHRRTYDTDEITLRKVFARTSTNMVVPAMTVLTADGAGGTYWAIPSTLGYNPSFNQIVTDAATFTANLSYNTLTLSEGGGIGFVEGEGTNQLYIYSKGFNQLNVAGGNSLYGFSNNVTRPALNFAGAGGISLQTNPTTNTVTFTANGQPISTTLNSFQSLKVFPNLSTPTGQVSSLSGYSVLSANNYSSILTLAGTGQISLTSDYNANAVFIGLNTSTLVTSNLTTQIVSTASIYASTLTLIDLVGGNPKNLYSYNGSLFLNGVAISGGAGTVAQIYGGSNIVLTGPTPGLGNVTVNVDTGFLTSTVIGLGTAGYISTASGGVAVLPGGLVSTANLENLISTSFFDTQLTSTVIGLGTVGYISSSQLLSTSAGLVELIQNPPGGVTPENLTSTVIGLGTVGYISSSQLLSTSAGLVELIQNPPGGVTPENLTSTVIGLGSADYISSSQLLSTSFGLAALIQNPPGGVTPENLTSTVIGLGTVGYLSTANGTAILPEGLVSTANLANLISTNFFDTQLTSTVIGLGTVGYLSSANGTAFLPEGLVSTANLANLISTSFFDTQLTSTVIGLGSAGYLSTANGTAVLPEGLVSTANLANLISTGFFDTQLTSTVIGLGTAGYVSTATLISFSTAQSQNFYSSNISVSSLTTSSLTFGTGSGYLFLPNTVMNSLSVGILIASTITNENIYILAGSKLILTSTVGINCNTPAYTLDVNGNINANTGYFLNGAVFTSDRRIKTNITSADTLLCYSTVRELPLHRFEYMSSFRQSKHDIKQIGFIADEVETVFPKSIYTAPVNTDGFSTLNFVNFEQIQMAHFGATQYMASLLEQQNSTIVGQNVSIGSLQTDVLNLSTTLGEFMTR